MVSHVSLNAMLPIYYDRFIFLCMFHRNSNCFCVCVFLVVVNMDYGMEGTNVALAVFIPTAIILVVVLGIYIYFTK